MINNLQIEARMNEQKKRMLKALKYLDFYNNNYTNYISKRLKTIYPNNSLVLSNFLRKYPLTLRLINDICILFKLKPIVESNDILDLFLNRSNFYSVLPTIQKYVTLLGKVGVMPRIYKDKIILLLLTPDKCFILQVEGFPTLIKALYYQTLQSQDSISPYNINTLTKITDLYIQIILLSMGRLNVISSLPNVYGYIPVIWFEIEPSVDSFWNYKTNPIIDLHEYYVLSKTYEAFALAYQAISTMVTKGLDPTAAIPFGPSTWINLPNNVGLGESDAKYINPGTDFESMYKFSDNILALASAYAGISAELYKKANQFASGYAMLLARIDVIDNNMSQIPMWLNKLLHLIECIVDTINLNTKYNINTLITVKINKPQTYTSKLESLEVIQKELDLGLKDVEQIKLETD